MQPNYCPNCGSERKFVPAGTSQKTGKPYTAFWSCPNNCKVPRNVAPPVAVQPVPQPVYQPPVPPQISREPVNQQPPVNTTELAAARELRIAKEAAVNALSTIMEPQKDLVEAADKLIEAARVLVKYYYETKEPVEASEEVLEEDLPF